MSVNFVVRSLFPERTAPAVRATQVAREAALAAINVFTEERFPGLEPRAYLYFDGSFSLSGFTAADGLTRAVTAPSGLRYDTKTKMLVAAKKTDEGKALATEMAALGYSHPAIDGLGGIVHGYQQGAETPRHLRQGYFLGWTFHVLDRIDGSVEVYATLPVKYLDEKSQSRVIAEDGVWESVRLSEFHAAREEHEERAQAVEVTA